MDELVTVYRIENTEGRGPYCYTTGFCAPITYAYDRGCNHPVPSEDGMTSEEHPYSPPQDFFYGFESLRSLARWFGGLPALRTSPEWSLVTYTVPKRDVIFGRSQVAFRKANAVANDIIA